MTEDAPGQCAPRNRPFWTMVESERSLAYSASLPQDGAHPVLAALGPAPASLGGAETQKKLQSAYSAASDAARKKALA